MVKTLVTQEDFNEAIANGVAVVDFYADWCGPCKILGPIMDKVSDELTDVTFAKVNVDEGRDVAMQFGIRSIPTIIFFKDGKEADKRIGMIPEANLIEIVNSLK